MDLERKRIFNKLVILSIFLSFAFMYIPYASIFYFVYGGIFVALGYAIKNKISIISYIIYISLFVYIFTKNTEITFFYVIVLLLPCIFVGKSFNKKSLKNYDYLIGSLIMFFSLILFYKFFVISNNIDVFADIKKVLENVPGFKSTIESNNITMDSIISRIKGLSPAIGFFYVFSYIFLSKHFGIFLIKKVLRFKELEIKPFSHFIIPVNFSFMFIVFYFFMYIMKSLNYKNLYFLDALINNLINIIVFLLFIQGLAIIMFSTNKIKNKVFRNFLITIIIISLPYLSLPLIIMAALDFIFDFRKIGFRGNNE